MARVLILGCGNPLRSDDGVAWHVLDAIKDLTENSSVNVEAVRQLTPELAEEVSDAETVIFVDAAEGDAGGRVIVRPVDETAPPETRFTHSLSPASLVSLARTLYGKAPKKAFLVTVAASSFELSENLSAPVARGVLDVANAIRNLISSAS